MENATNRFKALQQDQEDDTGGNYTVYKWEQETSAWTDAAMEGGDLQQSQLTTMRAIERERIRKAKIRRITPSIRRGLIRFLFLCLDCSINSEVSGHMYTLYTINYIIEIKFYIH
jgi:hypothetical protein